MDNQRNGPSTQWTINAMSPSGHCVINQCNGQSTERHHQYTAPIRIAGSSTIQQSTQWTINNSMDDQGCVTVSALLQSELQILLRYNGQCNGQSTQCHRRDTALIRMTDNATTQQSTQWAINVMDNQRRVTISRLHQQNYGTIQSKRWTINAAYVQRSLQSTHRVTA
jgi:hypothetical protein